MPSIWETLDASSNAYTEATTQEDWKQLLSPLFGGDGGVSWGDFWSDHKETFLNQFNYEKTMGANEDLARRSYTKGLESYTSQMYDKIQGQGRARGRTGFAGSGTGLGLQKNTGNLWSDYQEGLMKRKNDLNSQILGYGEDFKSDVLNYVNQLSAAGVFEG
tara:strand:+ start:945 stop:1427 length:483 start_codon:yes stop_codon:yes gene_type:complete